MGIKTVNSSDALSQEELRTVVHEAGALIPNVTKKCCYLS